jgi:AraC-like DNA-binding protein
MPTSFAPLLSQHSVFRSDDAEETRAFLQDKDFRIDFDRRGSGDMDARINGVYMPTMFLGYVQYGPTVELRAAHRDDYWIQLPTRGPIEIVSRAESIICDETHAAVASPTCEDYYRIRSPAGSAGLRVCLFRDALIGQLADWLGLPVNRALEFDSKLDLSTGHGRTLAGFIRTAIADIDSDNSMLLNPLAMSAFQQLILTGLLVSHPHSYSDALSQADRRIAPRDIRRAVDFIEAHLDSTMTVADLVDVSGVPGRTLFRHFKHFKGVSPMGYLRNARYVKVRDALLSAEFEANVTAIAMRWGFSHMGRFAKEYRDRFGETPSQTIKRRRH